MTENPPKPVRNYGKLLTKEYHNSKIRVCIEFDRFRCIWHDFKSRRSIIRNDLGLWNCKLFARPRSQMTEIDEEDSAMTISYGLRWVRDGAKEG